jgi:hypothetical protein
MRFVAEIEMEIKMEMMMSLTEMLDSTVMKGKEEAERYCPLSIIPPFIQSSGRGAPRCRVHTPIATYSSSELRNQLPSSYSRTEHGPTSDYHDEWRGKGRRMRKMRREEKKG